MTKKPINISISVIPPRNCKPNYTEILSYSRMAVTKRKKKDRKKIADVCEADKKRTP